MKNIVPNHIKFFLKINECIDNNKKSQDVASGHLLCSCGCNKFIVFREKWEPSQERDDAYKKLEALYRKYNNDKRFPTGNFIGAITNYVSENKSYIIYVPYKREKIILEDITELDRAILNDIGRIPTLILAICSQCNKEIEVFNSSKHGYDGLICENKREYHTIPRKKVSKCKKCSSEERILHIEFHYEDLESVKEDLGNEVDITNAFDWITIDLECANCKKLQKGYLDLETM